MGNDITGRGGRQTEKEEFDWLVLLKCNTRSRLGKRHGCSRGCSGGVREKRKHAELHYHSVEVLISADCRHIAARDTVRCGRGEAVRRGGQTAATLPPAPTTATRHISAISSQKSTATKTYKNMNHRWADGLHGRLHTLFTPHKTAEAAFIPCVAKTTRQRTNRQGRPRQRVVLILNYITNRNLSPVGRTLIYPLPENESVSETPLNEAAHAVRNGIGKSWKQSKGLHPSPGRCRG